MALTLNLKRMAAMTLILYVWCMVAMALIMNVWFHGSNEANSVSVVHGSHGANSECEAHGSNDANSVNEVHGSYGANSECVVHGSNDANSVNVVHGSLALILNVWCMAAITPTLKIFLKQDFYALNACKMILTFLAFSFIFRFLIHSYRWLLFLNRNILHICFCSKTKPDIRMTFRRLMSTPS